MQVNLGRVFWIWITLVVIITFCCGSEVTASVGNPPVPDFTLSAINTYAPLTVTMTDASTGNPDSWSWTIDNDAYKYGKGPFTYTFTSPGTYQIGLFVQNQYGSSFKEIPFVVYDASLPIQTCVITASPDKTTLGWGETVTFTGTAYGCLGTTKIPVIVRVRGPNLPATGLDLTRDLDYVTSPLDTNEAFPFTWYTGHAYLNNFLTYGVYTITFVDGTGAEYSPIKLDFSKQPICLIKAFTDKTQYSWGEQMLITGNAIDCPGGIKLKLGNALNGPIIPGVTPAPYGSGIPEGIDLATGQPKGDSAFMFTLDTGILHQQHSLQDGQYVIYALNMAEDQFVKVNIQIGTAGTGIPVPADCSHEVYVYVGKIGDRSKKSQAGIIVKAIGSLYDNMFSSAHLVDTTTTGTNGVGVLHIPKSAIVQWQYFHTLIVVPAGYGWGSARQSTSPVENMLAVGSSEVCGSFTEFWIIPLTEPQGTIMGTIPGTISVSEVTQIIQSEDQNTGKQTLSFFDYILSIPQKIMSFVQGSPAPDTHTTGSVQTTGSVSVVNIPEGANAEALEGSMQVVVLPDRDELRMETIQDADKIIPPPPALPEPQVVIIQEHMIAGTVEIPTVTSSPEPRAIIPENYIGSKPQILPIKFTCPAGYVTCNGQCVDLMTDTAYCGSCNSTCPSQFTCVAGVCTSQCNSGQTLCNGACASLLTDSNNCGSCGNVCTNGAACENGQCVLPMVKIQTTRLGDIGKVRF